MEMDSLTVDKLKHISNNEVVRRLLIKYFIDKGFDKSFDRQMYPSTIQDLPMIIPSLCGKVEIVPHAREIDSSNNKGVLSWNCFVLGSHRMYLGDTYHNDLRDLARQIRMGTIKAPDGIGVSATARRQTTPKRVIVFITRVLGDNESGYVDLNPTTGPVRSPGDQFSARQTLMGMPQQFFSRSGYGT